LLVVVLAWHLGVFTLEIASQRGSKKALSNYAMSDYNPRLNNYPNGDAYAMPDHNPRLNNHQHGDAHAIPDHSPPPNVYRNGDAAYAMEHSQNDDKMGHTTSAADESKTLPIDSNGHEDDAGIIYMTGLRFYLTCASLWLFFFMVTMEVSVVATALVGITREMGGSDTNNVSWIMSSYLLGYVAVMIITSKFSDVFGRKSLLVLCAAVFTVFSGACGAAQSITQL
jgi:hypothetical protein